MEEYRCYPAEIISIDKKRKLGDEQLETPLPKHIRIHPNTEAKKELARGFESEPESTNSNSVNDSDSVMSTEPESPDTYTSDSLSSLAATSSEPLYSSETTSSTISCCSEPESISINLGFSFDPRCIEKEIKNMLCSNGLAPTSNLVLSSNGCSVNQDSQRESKKLTIDKEFEQYFSRLML